MAVTPWGETDLLRSQKLRPGPGTAPDKVERSQRQRLIAATVAAVGERGYEATRVEDILAIAGVSRNSFYKLFSNKRECFVATLEAVTSLAGPMVLDVYDRTPGAWDDKIVALLDALANVVVAQPAVARMGWVEVYAAGPQAIENAERIDRAVEEIICRALEESPDHAGMPREITRAVVGAVRRIVHAHVREQRTEELPALMPALFEWMRSIRTPPERLRRPRRVPDRFAAPVEVPRDARERILVSVAEIVAEKGYPDMAITDIATRAAVSLTTFYAQFDGKEQAFLATLADAERRLLAATIARAAAETEWTLAVATGVHAFLGFLATEPASAHIGGVGVWATGPAGLKMHADGRRRFGALLNEGFRLYPATDPLVEEATGAVFDALIFTTLRGRGAVRLYQMAPTAIYLTLVPFVGDVEACRVANLLPRGIGQTTL
jgi:AcrR family transcriptional regulator